MPWAEPGHMTFSPWVSLCPCCKRKMARAISAKLGRNLDHGRSLTYADPDVKRSSVKVAGCKLFVRSGVYGSVCPHDCARFFSRRVLLWRCWRCYRATECINGELKWNISKRWSERPRTQPPSRHLDRASKWFDVSAPPRDITGRRKY